jgi:hypothetical protein
MTRPGRGVAALAVAVALAGCGERTATVVATTTTVASTTTTIAGPTTVGDFKGQKFDGGFVRGVTRTGPVVQISFDRYQVYVEQPDGQYVLRSGAELTTEPILFGNTDVPFVNGNPRLRTFTLAPDVTILRIAEPVPCASDDPRADPVWQPITVADLEGGAWKDRQEDSLTFNPSGLVQQLRLSTGC